VSPASLCGFAHHRGAAGSVTARGVEAAALAGFARPDDVPVAVSLLRVGRALPEDPRGAWVPPDRVALHAAGESVSVVLSQHPFNDRQTSIALTGPFEPGAAGSCRAVRGSTSRFVRDRGGRSGGIMGNADVLRQVR
jgi:hypothetical protein